MSGAIYPVKMARRSRSPAIVAVSEFKDPKWSSVAKAANIKVD
jgi:hypothetical protein